VLGLVQEGLDFRYLLLEEGVWHLNKADLRHQRRNVLDVEVDEALCRDLLAGWIGGNSTESGWSEAPVEVSFSYSQLNLSAEYNRCFARLGEEERRS